MFSFIFNSKFGNNDKDIIIFNKCVVFWVFEMLRFGDFLAKWIYIGDTEALYSQPSVMVSNVNPSLSKGIPSWTWKHHVILDCQGQSKPTFTNIFVWSTTCRSVKPNIKKRIMKKNIFLWTKLRRSYGCKVEVIEFKQLCKYIFCLNGLQGSQ